MHHWTRHDGQKNIRTRVFLNVFPAGDFLSMLYSTRVTLTVFELYPGTGSVEESCNKWIGPGEF